MVIGYTLRPPHLVKHRYLRDDCYECSAAVSTWPPPPTPLAGILQPAGGGRPDPVGHCPLWPAHLVSGSGAGADCRAYFDPQLPPLPADQPALHSDHPPCVGADSGGHLYLCPGSPGLLVAGSVGPATQPLRQDRPFQDRKSVV